MKKHSDLKATFQTAGFSLVLLTMQSTVNTKMQAQQPITPVNIGMPGMILQTTFENRTAKLLWVNESIINLLDELGLLIIDPSGSSAWYSRQAIRKTDDWLGLPI
jgi:hypothetical protein